MGGYGERNGRREKKREKGEEGGRERQNKQFWVGITERAEIYCMGVAVCMCAYVDIYTRIEYVHAWMYISMRVEFL